MLDSRSRRYPRLGHRQSGRLEQASERVRPALRRERHEPQSELLLHGAGEGRAARVGRPGEANREIAGEARAILDVAAERRS